MCLDIHSKEIKTKDFFNIHENRVKYLLGYSDHPAQEVQTYVNLTGAGWSEVHFTGTSEEDKDGHCSNIDMSIIDKLSNRTELLYGINKYYNHY